MISKKCKLLIIGAGPGGYVCAIRAGQLGVDTIIVEESHLGGTCLNVGCIPSKAIIHASNEFEKARENAKDNPLGIRADAPEIDFSKTIDWKNGIVDRLTQGVAGLLKKAKVQHVNGRANFIDGKTVDVTTAGGIVRISTENVVIATGSKSIELPSLPFGGKICSSTEALELRKPPKKLIIIGGGYIGLELGMAYAKLGSKVTIVEASANILSMYDDDLRKPVEKRMKELGITLHCEAQAQTMSEDGKALLVSIKDKEVRIPTDKVFVTVGRKPNLTEFGLEKLSLVMNGSFLKISNKCLTSMRDVYAIGDVTGEPMLAHRAMAQGEMVAEIVSGSKRVWDKRCIPAVCFTDPEIVSVGMSATDVVKNGIEVVTGKFPFSASGRAMSTEREDGFVTVIARKDNHEVLGIQGVGAEISELSGAFTLAIEMASTLEDLSMVIQAHPTRAEALQESAFSALGRSLHM
ncbi:dihydrolipoyl dehydrogenase [Hirschia baltica]|uniref:Dihydrolipoyl dehydrogenase n=1 Tax=Hirschia baltica (strain ATCC 49814 / DSM 5838 / IFAM 1418) TaxID=582402 RepID=C6XJL0_HIRBI|nr:dihydrolipoyl dehydrogenase [Hirschia baltica]ACT59305.1 dihydrolipoamide dehydrogenase [Hirschia baltica ATCC 49814]